ncbi:MAG: prolyl oligopeptidase family serine peptidase [Sphingomonas fennica]
MTTSPATAADPAITYPKTEATGPTETVFGETVADPYRWLEADVREDAKVKAWVDAQVKVTDAYLATLPGRDAIAARLKQMWDFERFGLPRQGGGRLFYQRNSGLQNQSPLYVQEGPAGNPRLLLDPNPWAKDGATALAEWSPSDDGTHVAFAVQDGGSDWRTIRVLDVATGAELADRLEWAKFTAITWAKDGRGFYYARFAKPPEGAAFQAQNLNHEVYYHALGTAQAADRLVYATPDRPKLTHETQITDDGRWLVFFSTEDDSAYQAAAIDLAKPGATPRTIVPYADHKLGLVGSTGERLILTTTDDAPRRQVVSLDMAGGSGLPRATTLIAEGKGTIEGGSILGDHIVLTTMEDARSVVRRFTLAGAPAGEVALPGIGSAFGFESGHGAETYYAFTSFNVPTTIYRYDAAANASALFRKPETPFDPAQYEVRQLFYPSKDGTRIPMFVAHRKGLDLSKGAPTMLYGYGGFDVSLTPGFSVARLQWMEMGGVYVVANLRGGGEYGKAWHDAGRRANKQNVFDDFIAAGEYLVAQGITTPAQLAINGGSNGGLLVGAVTNQRPDLFAAALPQVGVMDMLRFTRFTAGRYWTGDYGDPAVAADWRVLRAYSPYHNIRSGKDYPAILVTTADTDDRVVPGHSFKYAAAIQAAAIGDKPHLIRIETRAGHGSGKPTDKAIAEYADMWAFAARWTGLTPPK